MGIPKVKWTSEEEQALRAGVQKYGAGKWKNILTDPAFAPSLTNRSNIDLKDKWRNMYVSSRERDISRTPKLKALPTNGELANNYVSAPAVPIVEDNVAEDPSRSPQDARNAPRYDAMIFEALASIKDSRGSDILSIMGFIEQRHEIPLNFRRILGSRLRRLVLQGKLEKVQKRYKITDVALGSKTPLPNQKVLKKNSKKLEEASINAAYSIAEAENKSFLASEAGKEAERISYMAEETEAVLEFMNKIYQYCSHGQVIVVG